MRARLIAYLLNDLSAEEQFRVEEFLRQDPQWQQEFERLKSCLEACENEAEDDATPPRNLTTRTCCLIQKATRQGANGNEPVRHSKKPDLCLQQDTFSAQDGPVPAAAFSPVKGLCGSGQRWSLVDLAAAGGVLATLAMLLLPALHQGREASRRLTCQNNLRAVGKALFEYTLSQQALPPVGPQENAGIFTVKLTSSGVIDAHQLAQWLVCPSSPLAEEVFSGHAKIPIPTARQLALASPKKLLLIRRRMGGSYAYRLGYFDQGGYHNIPFTERSDSPMLADAPAPQTDGFYSSYHGGCGSKCGENVLFQDSRVQFCRPCMVRRQQDNIYLNSDNQQAAGKGPLDIVLGRSEVRPDGFTLGRWP